MAEKEERITIHEVAYPCKKCSINCNKNDWKDCDFYQNYISGMPRQEAINRMAEAMNNLTRKAIESKKTPCIPPETYAEAMLNSLLEVK